MAYQQNPDGPVVDKGAFRARILEVCGICLVGFIIVFLVIKLTNTKEKRIEKALSSIKIDLQYSPYNYKINNTEDSLTFILWGDGLTALSRKAYDGHYESQIEWRKTKDNILTYANGIDIELNIRDIKDMEVTVQLVGEDDHSLVLLVFKNLKDIYDIVRDIGG